MASVTSTVLKSGKKAYIVNFRDPDGRSRRKSHRTATAARDFARSIETDKRRGDFIDPRGTKINFQTFAEDWLASQKHYSPATLEMMERRFRLHIFPHLGSKTLAEIRPSTIGRWLAKLPLADSTKRGLLAHVSSVLEAAHDDRLVGRNAARAKTVRRPKPAKGRVQAWPRELLAQVHNALLDHLRIVVYLGGGLGLRQGEILGLATGDIDFDSGVVHIRRQRLELKHGTVPIFKLPKRDKQRTVPLPDVVAVAIREYLGKYPPLAVTLPSGNADGKLVTHNLIVSHLSRQKTQIPLGKKALNYAWARAVGQAGIELGNRENGMHSLRHYFASVLIDSGENIKALAEYMGHSDVRETLETYAHMMPQSQARTMSAIDTNFGSDATFLVHSQSGNRHNNAAISQDTQ